MCNYYEETMPLFTNEEDHSFISFVNVEYYNLNRTYEMLCIIHNKYKSGKNVYLQCVFNIEKSQTIKYDNIYLLPYYMPYEMLYQYEVIIKKAIMCGRN